MQVKTLQSKPVPYFDPRHPEDLDLVQQVRTWLKEVGVTEYQLQLYDQHRFITEAHDKRPDVQRFLLNQYWNLQLMSVPANTFNERFSLVPNGTLDDWSRLFKEVVLPTIVAQHLPREFD